MIVPKSLIANLPLARRPAAVWIETAMLVLIVPALGWWLSPKDPLFVRTAFPWAVLAPLLAGLRYGFAPGFAAAAALTFAALAAAKGILLWPAATAEMSPERTVGLLLCGMLTGEFSGLWRRRIEALESVHEHQRARFESFLRSYQTLRMSHDLLESRLGGAPPTLRDALRALGELPVVSDEPGRAALGKRILELFATYAQVRQGAIFLAPEPDAPLLGKPAARIGAVPDIDDPLVEEAIRRREVVTFESAAAASGAARPEAVVLAAPLEDVEGRLWGVLAVTELPFAAFGPDAPVRFASLAGHVADRLAFVAPDRVAEEHQDGVGMEDFARRLRRAAHDRRAHGLASGVVQFAVEGKRAAVLAQTIAHQRRITDQVLTAWRGDGRATVTLLLPMTDDIGMARYLGRVEAAVRAATGASLRDAGVRLVEHAAIDDSERIASLDLASGAPNNHDEDDAREIVRN